MQSVHVRSVFSLYLPLAASKETNRIVHDITSVPSVSFSLYDKDQIAQAEYYHIKLLIIEPDDIERELIGGLIWSKRRPLNLIQDSVNQLAGISLRFKIPEGVIDFRKHRLRPNRARIIISNANGGSWINQATTPIFEIHQKRRLPESNAQNQQEVTIGLQWVNAEISEQDSVQDSLVITDEVESPEFVTNNSIELLPDFSMLNEGYVRLYDGNAEITGNLRALNFYKLSDRRMKTDITSLSNRDCRKILLCIEGVEYKFKAGNAVSNRKFIGNIAQQVQQVIPEAVTTIDGVLHVDYQSIVPYISEALRQTNADVEGIESNLKQFQKLLENLHTRFCEHEAEHYYNVPPTQRTASNFKRIPVPYWLLSLGSCLFLTVMVLAAVFLAVGSVDQSRAVKNQAAEEAQRAILTELYIATNGDEWLNNTGWLSQENSVCDWSKVKCDENGELTALWLSYNGLNGTIPNSVANLTSLIFLQFSSNQVSGTIPEVLGQLQRLQVLTLDSNEISGTIPESLGQLQRLEKLSVGHNQLSGTIPASLGQLKYLQTLEINNNRLSGTIPQSFEQLKMAKSLDFGGNQLTGSIPSFLGELLQLKQLDLGNNQLSETIPESIGNLTALEFFDVSHNMLVGTLPPSLFAIEDLVQLSLNDNQLSGTIPYLTAFRRMLRLDLSNNKFQKIQARFIDNSKMTFMCRMQNNPLVCPIPKWSIIDCGAWCKDPEEE